MRVHKLFRSVVLLILSVMFLSGFTVVGKGYELYRNAVGEMSLEEKVASVQKKEGYTTLEDLPDVYKNAVISVEDHRFYSHFGIDPIAIGRAVLHDIQAGRYVEGGSTITQQLAKNLYFSNEKKMTRKIAEVFMAFEFEKKCSKEEIFELYVNTIYFGDGYYCIYDASNGYFDKMPNEMNLYECTLLAGIPNAPSVYSPNVNPELSKQRQAQVLNKMLKYDFITEEEANKILDEM